MESKALAGETIFAFLTQDEASELEYHAGLAELRNRLRASSLAGCEAAAAPQSSTNSGTVLHTWSLLHLLYLSFELPN